jgi:acyl-CoA reductase-like NAD-dependent aldehyde dehydrogenase
MGPLVSASQYARVMAYVDVGHADGARLLTGGSRPPSCPRGFFLAPTVFTGVTPLMRIWREEIFGPVLSGACMYVYVRVFMHVAVLCTCVCPC